MTPDRGAAATRTRAGVAPWTLHALEIRRKLGVGDWSAPIPHGPDGWAFRHLTGDGTVIVSVAPMDDGVEWIHASMTRRGRVPSYTDLTLLRAAVFGHRWAYQVFAPPAGHVNLHEFALHLYGRLDGESALPDFTLGTGSI